MCTGLPMLRRASPASSWESNSSAPRCRRPLPDPSSAGRRGARHAAVELRALLEWPSGGSAGHSRCGPFVAHQGVGCRRCRTAGRRRARSPAARWIDRGVVIDELGDRDRLPRTQFGHRQHCVRQGVGAGHLRVGPRGGGQWARRDRPRRRDRGPYLIGASRDRSSASASVASRPPAGASTSACPAMSSCRAPRARVTVGEADRAEVRTVTGRIELGASQAADVHARHRLGQGRGPPGWSGTGAHAAEVLDRSHRTASA